VVPSEFDSISTGAPSGPEISASIATPFDWITGMFPPDDDLAEAF
jgi:hypothetical protein